MLSNLRGRKYDSTAMATRPSLQSITFDTTGLRFDREEADRKIWFTEDGDGISLNFFNKPPDLPQGMRSLQDVRENYQKMMNGSSAKLVNINLVTASKCPVICLIIKFPQQPRGMTYVGSFTIPFRDSSYVLKMQCQERGMTGTREAVLFDRHFKTGKVKPHASGNLTGMPNFDAAEFDFEFPQHPVSKTRRMLNRMFASMTLDPVLQTLPKFPLPISK
jgi:hypothetical protein